MKEHLTELQGLPATADHDDRPAALRDMKVKILSRTIAGWVDAMVMRRNADGSYYVEDQDADGKWYEPATTAWRMLLDDVGNFVRDFGRWSKPSDTHIEEDLLAKRLARGKEEFDEAHLTELRNLQIARKEDALREDVEGLQKEVTELGRWLHHDDRPAALRDMKVKILSRTIAEWVDAMVMRRNADGSYYVEYQNADGESVVPDDEFTWDQR